MPTDKREYYYPVQSDCRMLSELEKEQLEETIKLLEDMYLESKGA